MKKHIRHIEVCLLIAIAAAMLLEGCSSSETSDLCENIATSSKSGFYFAASPNTSVRVITSQPAKKFCTAGLGIKVRYESEDRAREKAPVNIKVEFAVEDGSGNPATIFPAGEPVYTTLYQRRYIQWGVSVNAADREEPVNYYIRIAADEAGDFPVLADAAIRYTRYETPRGILH
jgi:hypothetical protein